jgi:Predicted permeases
MAAGELLSAAAMTHDLLAIVSGTLVGFSLALTGGGGSILAVPLLIYVVGMQDAHMAIGTSAFAVSLNAYANLIPHARAGNVRWREGIIFTVSGIVGAFIGSSLGKLVNGASLLQAFAVLMIVVALLMLKPRKQAGAGGTGAVVPHLTLRLVVVGMGAGIIAGFFGIGGGFLIVPGLMLASHMEILYAIGTSLFGVGSFGLATAINYSFSGLVDWGVAFLFIGGGIIGGWVGAMIARRLAQKKGVLNLIFSTMIIAVAVFMLVHPKHKAAHKPAAQTESAATQSVHR